MNVYIASKFQNAAEMETARDCLAQRGHEITWDWTKQTEPYNSKDGAARRAEAEYAAVRRAGALLVIAYDGMRGSMVEFGIALGLDKPVVVLTPERCYTIFYEHPRVVCFEMLDDALNMIDLLAGTDTAQT